MCPKGSTSSGRNKYGMSFVAFSPQSNDFNSFVIAKQDKSFRILDKKIKHYKDPSP